MAVVNRNRVTFGESANGTYALVYLLNKDALVDLYVGSVYQQHEVSVKPVEQPERELNRESRRGTYDTVYMRYPIDSQIMLTRWEGYLVASNATLPGIIIGKSDLEGDEVPLNSVDKIDDGEGMTMKETPLKSEDTSSWIVAVDSERIIYIFWKNNGIWGLYTSFKTKLRVMLLTIDPGSKYLVLTDKCGDVYVSCFGTRNGASQFKRILGHCGLILDTMVSGNLIFTADRDKKIRCSQFPQGHEIKYYLLGHPAPVVSVAICRRNENLISISTDGVIKAWNLADQKCITSFGIFLEKCILASHGGIVSTVTQMKIHDEPCGSVTCAVMISKDEKIHVFKLSKDLKNVAFLGTREKNGQMWFAEGSLWISDAKFPAALPSDAEESLPMETKCEFEVKNKKFQTDSLDFAGLFTPHPQLE